MDFIKQQKDLERIIQRIRRENLEISIMMDSLPWQLRYMLEKINKDRLSMAVAGRYLRKHPLIDFIGKYSYKPETLEGFDPFWDLQDYFLRFFGKLELFSLNHEKVMNYFFKKNIQLMKNRSFYNYTELMIKVCNFLRDDLSIYFLSKGFTKGKRVSGSKEGKLIDRILISREGFLHLIDSLDEKYIPKTEKILEKYYANEKLINKQIMLEF